MRNNSQWPPGYQNLLFKILRSYCCKWRGTFSSDFLSADSLTHVHYQQKCPSSQIKLKLSRFRYSKAGHCKNLSDLKHKICSKILQKFRPVTLIKNVFLKTFEGQQLFSERLKDIFSRVFIHVFWNF